MKLYDFAAPIVRGILKVVILFQVRGNENIPPESPFLLCANHRSNMDPVLLAAGSRRCLTFMAKDELFHVPVLGWLIKHLGAFPIKRGRGDAAPIIATLKILKSGGATLIFPEGQRMRGGQRKKVNSGIVRLAIQANVPIVPAFVGKRSVVYGKPVRYENVDIQNTGEMQRLADELMDNIYGLESAK